MFLPSIRALRHIRPAITASDANMIACSVVGSRLDYANAVLYGASSKNIQRLQRIQNALARCVVDSKVRMRCYNNYTGCRSISALTSNLRSLRSLLAHLPPFVPELISCPISAIPYAPRSRYLPARCSQDKDSSLVRARFASLRRLFLINILFLRTLD